VSRWHGLLLPVALLAVSGCAVGPAWQDLTSASSPLPVVTTTQAASATAAPAAPAGAADTSAGVALIATLRRPTRVLRAPGGALLVEQPDKTDEGTRQRLLVLQDRQEWLQVALPGRPRGRTGWLRAGDADLSATDWRLRVSLGTRRLTVLRGGMVYGEHPVAVGTAATPTPKGLFYLTDLLAPPDPDGAYGPYAFGLSAYSDVVTSFGRGGRGQIGLHGTSARASIGQAVSNGCLRLDNETITALARELPLGTPFEITA
jgi:L,D-transpeptidase catalytic domain